MSVGWGGHPSLAIESGTDFEGVVGRGEDDDDATEGLEGREGEDAGGSEGGYRGLEV